MIERDEMKFQLSCNHNDLIVAEFLSDLGWAFIMTIQIIDDAVSQKTQVLDCDND